MHIQTKQDESYTGMKRPFKPDSSDSSGKHSVRSTNLSHNRYPNRLSDPGIQPSDIFAVGESHLVRQKHEGSRNQETERS